MRILYITRNFNYSGYSILQSLIKNDIPLIGIVVKPGRNNKLLIMLDKVKYFIESIYFGHKRTRNFMSEKILAKKNKIKVYEFSTLKSKYVNDLLLSQKIDLILLGGGWHELIPNNILRIPKYGCVNTHPSLLPKYRGTSITRWQILNQVRQSGVTLHIVDENFDTGSIISQSKIRVDINETPQKLFKKLGTIGADLVLEFVTSFIKNQKISLKKSNTKSTQSSNNEYYSLWNWRDNTKIIDLNLKIEKIHSIVLANNQENYKYKYGPVIKINQEYYFLRKTKLLTYSEYKLLYNDIPDTNFKGLLFHSSNLVLQQKKSKHLMLIEKIQLRKKFLLRKAFKPYNLIKKLK